MLKDFKELVLVLLILLILDIVGYRDKALDVSEEDNIVGELYIVSYKGDKKKGDFGHSWLVYHSYIDDVLEIGGCATGYFIDGSGGGVEYSGYKMLESTTLYPYWIKAGDYVSIGYFMDMSFNVWLTEIGKGMRDKEILFWDDMSLNTEFHNLERSNDYYSGAIAYAREITKGDLIRLINEIENMPPYNLFSCNCTYLSTYCWNILFGEEDRFINTDVSISVSNSPASLYEQIENREGHIEHFDKYMLNILKRDD